MIKKTQFQNIMHLHKDRVLNYAIYFLKNRQDAEDITQEVFIKLWNSWEHIDRRKVRPWLMQVTHNRCIDYYRKWKNSAAKNIDLDDVLESKYYDMDNTMMMPDTNQELKELQQTLLDALDQVPLKTKSVFLLHYFHGFKLEEVGEIIDVNLNTVKVTLHRGKKSLKTILKRSFPEIVEAL